ncbi:MAG: hypothetical protein IJV13_09290 [Prevotella sp.]|nr:hypothetical protein [Prevotella sp.]
MKKLFTLLTLALFAMVVNAQTPTDEVLNIANGADVEAQANLNNIKKLTSWDADNGVLVMTVYGANESSASNSKNLGFVTYTAKGSSNETWEAPAGSVFKGSAYYHTGDDATTNDNKRASVKEANQTTFKVTNCVKVAALVKSNGTSDAKAATLTVKEVGATDPVASLIDYTKTIVVLEKGDLDATKTYEVTIAGTGTSNSNAYEVAFWKGNASSPEPTPTTTVTDVLTSVGLGATDGAGNSYADFTDKTFTSDAVYSANMSAGNVEAIQLRSNNNNSGIVTTTSGGKLKKVVVTWASNTNAARAVEIFGSNTAYTAPTDLYNDETKGTSLGTLAIAEATELVSTLEVDGDYEYFGLKSTNGALYLAKIEVEWEAAGTTPEPTPEHQGTKYEKDENAIWIQANHYVAENKYELIIEADVEMEGLGGSFWALSSGNADMRDNLVLSADKKTMTITAESTTKPNPYTPLYVLMPGEVNFGDIDYQWVEIGEVTPEPDAVPAAPAPTLAADMVYNIFSDTYGGAANGFHFEQWGAPTTKEDVELATGDVAWHIANMTYHGTQFAGDDFNFDASEFKSLHMDIYPVSEGMELGITPVCKNVEGSGNEAEHCSNTGVLTAGQWNQVEIAVADMVALGNTLKKVFQLKFTGKDQTTEGHYEYYIDNIYFEKVAEEPDEEVKLYVLGGTAEWTFANNEELTFDETAQAFKYEIDSAADYYFAFADKNDCATWDELNGEHRLAIAAGDQVPELNKEIQLVKANGTIKLAAGKYTVTVTKDFKMTITGEAADGISNIAAEKQNGVIYNLQGQRVNAAQKGIYIMNGKKVLVK